MAVTQPVLESQTLAYPTEYTEQRLYRGTATEMADGSERIDLVNANAKHEFTMSWVGLTAAQKATITTAFDTLKSSYSANNFTSPNGTTYTVTRGSELSWTTFISVADLRYNTSSPLILREV
jgi:hypothetical protein